MTDSYYKSISRESICAHPETYAWNCLLYYQQFSREELLHFKNYVDIESVVKYQISATYAFLESHFAEEIDECLEVDWNDVRKYTKGR
jgi:hypothetical protein